MITNLAELERLFKLMTEYEVDYVSLPDKDGRSPIVVKMSPLDEEEAGETADGIGFSVDSGADSDDEGDEDPMPDARAITSPYDHPAAFPMGRIGFPGAPSK